MYRSVPAPRAECWRGLVTNRLDELARLSPGAGLVSGSFWDKRAERYDRSARLAHPDSDPFLRRLLRASDASSSALDVGAGTGRFALALAGAVAHVTAVEPSAAMLDVLERRAEQLGVANVTTIRARWEDADVEPADVAFSSFVLALVPDAVPFLEKLDGAARRRVVLYLGAFSADALLDPLWRHFHDVPRVPGPSYLDALAVLREMGIEPAVKVVEIPNRRRFATLDEAVEHYRDALLVPDTPENNSELAQLLAAWLLGRRGALRSPLRTTPAAILEWTPRSRA
ncbi:MAG TPA: class I SAM-dependent methyltransferase [Solirubrobacteraceae bacterium]|nr:class I SAM-dependent methyltransferase [Solirubrobacteraceae bacterium]